MEKVVSNFNFSTIEKIMFGLDEDHSSTTLSRLKAELNKFFNKSKCHQILYTLNTDKLFFGMRVYPMFDGNDAMEILGDENSKIFSKYSLEFDSKLFDPMLALDEKELTAILLHEIGHIVYDTATIDEVRGQIDMYFSKTGESVNLKASRSYKELLAYALKDSVVKAGSIFSKIGDTEIIADTFVVACGYGAYLESGMKKIAANGTFLNKEVDDRFLVLSWVLRLNTEFNIRRIPAIKTLNKAKMLTGSKLEQRELTYATSLIQRNDMGFSEGFVDNVKDRFSRKVMQFKTRGVRAMKDDVYELNVRLRCAETEEDLMFIIRTINTDVAILKDYLTEDISDEERKSIQDTLQELYDIRQRAAKDKTVRDRYSSMINVVYTN